MFNKFRNPDTGPGFYIKAKPDLACPSLDGLIYALRNLGEVLPESSGIISPATPAP